MAFAYLLRCSDDCYYVGSTVDLAKRLQQHAAGTGASYTRGRLPVTLVWAREFDSIFEAFQAEKQIQNWSRAKREALIEGRLDDLPALARGRTGWLTRGGLD